MGPTDSLKSAGIGPITYNLILAVLIQQLEEKLITK